jgi:FtsZ-binding cell division protein ZapB
MGIQDSVSTKDKRNNLIVIVLAVLLLAVTVMFFVQRGKHHSVELELNMEKDSIAAELTQMVNGYDSLKTENDALNQNIELAQIKVKDLLSEVEQVKSASYQQISKYRDEMTTLRKIMRDYVVQIDSLNQKNQRLMAENRDVKQQYAEARDVNEQLQQEKKKLEQTVTLAAQLEAVGMHATGINKKGNEQNRAAKIEKIKIDFTLSKNLTAKRGAKNIYVRIQRPDQILLMKSEKDVFRFEDLKIPYSTMREVEYEGNELPVSIYWDNTGEAPLMTGVYTIDLFADGNNIGTTRFEVK